MSNRQSMSPQEFDAACRELEWSSAGDLHQSSGTRSVAGNANAGGHIRSKHLYGMARDYHWHPEGGPEQDGMDAIRNRALEAGFWIKAYPWGIHLQGLPPGPIARWWWEKYGDGLEGLGLDVEGEE